MKYDKGQERPLGMIFTSLPIYLLIGVVFCAPERVQNDHESHEEGHDVQNSAHSAPLEKRSPHYNFGLGKRAYSYVSEYKRLPVYNFGLGKRSRPYSFGLGKRSIEEDQSDEEMTNDLDQTTMADLFDNYDDTPEYEKRARPYSFGLGKRVTDAETSEDKRARMYNFGLGKRLPMYNFGLGKRARAYSFGLGKRISKFSFGLGKRQKDLHRFSFGLGKRSDDTLEDTDNYIDV
ncbi:hypothetical protein K1T71_011648 [Dendrolimus kikuchii]|uniref:Uncharacterized protein n=1 Tax=Dendrolimus kikuchii TaxID=765133 RepID=A0ACC1CM57_9NEOP|nr:hypothetical protein K1T71_011648 [Dendrolimus kikuchii]